MRTDNLVAEGDLEFLDLHHRRSGHATLSTNFDDLEVRMDFDSKDAFRVAVKRIVYIIVSTSMLHALDSKYKTKCAMCGTECPWKIMIIVRKKLAF